MHLLASFLTKNDEWFGDRSEKEQSQVHALWLERSPAKHGRLGLIVSWVKPKTLKMVSTASLS